VASSSELEPVANINSLAALFLGEGVELLFNCLIIENRQAVQSMWRSMDWTLEENMVDGLFLCTTLTGRRGGHTPFVQAGVETSDTGVEAVKSNPYCSWKDHSPRIGASVPDENTESRGVVQPRRIRDPPNVAHVCCCCQIN